jgi:hypothetical protein
VRLTRDETSWQSLSTAPNPKSGLLFFRCTALLCRVPAAESLARIGGSLPPEVPIDIAARHKFARDTAHRANKGFLALRRGSRAQTGLFYKNSSDKGLVLALWRGKSIMPQKKALYKSSSEARIQR